MSRVRLHIHVAGRRVYTRDIGPALRPADPDGPEWSLVNRLMQALADLDAGMTTDEKEGHEFHGNQYTGGLGAKPDAVKEKGVKAGVHELLSSGHPFSMEELQKITGATTIKQISDALAMLKNPKYAGSKGTLEIVKGPGGFSVKPKAELPDPDADLVSMPYKTPELPAPPVPEDLDPQPEWEPGMLNTAPPAEAHPSAVGPAGSPGVPPAGGPLTKEVADKYYGDHIDDALTNVKAMTEMGATAEETAQYWKDSKATAMAQWKANTTGTPIVAKKQEVFKADLQLAEDIKGGMGGKEALAAWKKNTAGEKAGTWPAKPAINPMPKPSAPPADVFEKHAPAYEPVADYVPKDHAHVSAEDFAPKQGAVDGHFAKQLGSLKSSLSAGHPDAVQNKIGVQAALEKRLADSPAFQSIQKQFSKTKGMQSLAAALISSWASTSGDSHPVSIANQISVREAFKMNPDDVSSGNMSNVHTGPHDDDKVFEQAAGQLGCKYDTPEQRETFRAGLRDFALAQYHNTQEHFAQLGIKEVCVVRGMKIAHGANADAQEGNLKLQPVSSFSANFGTAASFAGGQTLYMSKVPVSQVFSSYVTGFGCSSEHEVCVLAHPELRAVRMPVGKASKAYGEANMKGAAAYVHETLGKKAPGYVAPPPAPAKIMSKAKAEMHLAGGFPIAPNGANANTAHKINEHLAEGNLAGLKELQSGMVGKKMPKSKAFVKAAIEHLEAKAALAHHAAAGAPKAPKAQAQGSSKSVPHWPNGASNNFTHEAKIAAEKGDHAKLEAIAENLNEIGNMPMSEEYVDSLIEHVKSQQAGAQAKAAITKAQTTPHVPHTGPVPAGHALHSHYDPAEYQGWVAKGHSTHQLGKKLAMKKFLSKKQGATA